MTALKEFERLECTGIWKSGPDAQRRDVVVSFGDATLVIADGAGRPITHWSLAAVERTNPGDMPALFAPDIEASETLELDDDIMIGAIEKVRKSVARTRPRPGRLRQFGTWGASALVVGLVVFWLPGALRDQATKVVPQVKRAEIGATLLGHLQRLTGATCRSPLGTQALTALHHRLFGAYLPGQIVVASDGIEGAVALPGGILVVGHGLVENYEDPAVLAGFVLAAAAEAEAHDPLRDLLKEAGVFATLRLLATGELASEKMQTHAEGLIATPAARPDDDRLLQAFSNAGLPTTPYAYAVDPTGETTLGLIEADPMAGQTYPLILTDSDWVALQGICAN